MCNIRIKWVYLPDLSLGNDGIDQLQNGTGHDLLTCWTDNTQLHGNIGNDALLGDCGADALFGGEGVERLFNINADDYLGWKAGNDALDNNDDFETLVSAVTGSNAIDSNEMVVTGEAGNIQTYPQDIFDVIDGQEATSFEQANEFEADDNLIDWADNDLATEGAGADLLFGDANGDPANTDHDVLDEESKQRHARRWGRRRCAQRWCGK